MAGGGSKPGERRGGRQKGTPNKTVPEIRQLARSHCAEAIEGIIRLAKVGDTDAVKLAAMKELLDRGLGKATQLLGQDDEAAPLFRVSNEPISTEAWQEKYSPSAANDQPVDPPAEQKKVNGKA